MTFSCGRLLKPPCAEVEPPDAEPEFADADPEPVVVPLLLPDVLPPAALLPEPVLAPPLAPTPLPLRVALPPAADPSIMPMISTRWPTYCSISRSRLPVRLK